MSCLIMTLDEMLKLSLGTSPLTNIQVAILHSFLKILIQKLNIQTDFVEISGTEVKHLREMMCKAHNPLVDFTVCSDEKLNRDINIYQMEEDINKLTEIVNKLESDLKQHLEAIERCKRPPAMNCLQLRRPKNRPLPEDESFSSDCEDLCTPCDEKSLIACDLLQNQTFLKKLMRRITSPVVDRIFEFETMINMLNEKFQNFLNTAQDEYQKVPLIEDCLRETRSVKKQLDKQHEEFIETMEEIQEMMDGKLDKMHIPALKKYISDKMSNIERKLEAVIQKEQCPKAAGVIMTNLQCLCCTTKVCQKDKVYPVPLLGDVKRFKVKSTSHDPNFCIPQDRPRACGGDHTVIRPNEKTLQKLNLLEDFGDQMNLPHDLTNNVKYFKGLHGRMYRQGPKTDILK
ncbi:uncharacterized protein LOC129911314 [Episyrphus balteatus]|uniref:uncharacterized protein LOC129911314 n=1 Tax=Episyrphus balteatus TaxID=286459 RepID=UPI002486CACB|nr:uncharacterized protein LOC129911314 [Episyrphus balteatus]